jgi:hypothetical protein
MTGHPLAATLLMLGAVFAPATAQEAGGSAPSDLVAAQQRQIESRALEAAIWGMPAVNTDLMLQQATKAGAKPGNIVYWGRPLDWHNQTLTPNPDAIYLMSFYDLTNGPVVLQVPPAEDQASINGNIVTVWQMPLEDVGLHGVDAGKGGKFVLLPPGYKEPLAEGYIPLQSDTLTGYALFRSNLKSHSDADVAASVAYGKKWQVYPLSAASNPPPTKFIDPGDAVFDSTIRYDASFFESLDRAVQKEPWLDRDRAMIDILKSIGIERGKPFSPDADMKAAMESGIKDAQVLLEARYDAGFPPFWDGVSWALPAVPALVESAQAGFALPDAYPVDDRALAYTYAFIGLKRMGAGQFYLMAIKDKDGAAFDGKSTYKLTVPPNVPVSQYWSATAYDRVTHALIRNMDRASRSSQIAELKKNADGSIDLYFGPKPREGMDNNWVPTDPAREFEVMFRLYGPTEGFFKKIWVLPDLEKVS